MFCYTNKCNMLNQCRDFVDTSILTNFYAILTCFFDVFWWAITSFHLEVSHVIIQCLRKITLVDICSDLIYLQWQRFPADILWKFPGNGQRTCPFSGSCRFMKTAMRVFSFSVTLKADFCNNVLLQIFSLVESGCIEIRVLLPATLQKHLPEVNFLGISRTNTLQRCIQTQSNI